MRAQIKKGKVMFPAPYWEHVSDSAKDFICKVRAPQDLADAEGMRGDSGKGLLCTTPE